MDNDYGSNNCNWDYLDDNDDKRNSNEYYMDDDNIFFYSDWDNMDNYDK